MLIWIYQYFNIFFFWWALNWVNCVSSSGFVVLIQHRDGQLNIIAEIFKYNDPKVQKVLIHETITWSNAVNLNTFQNIVTNTLNSDTEHVY